MGLLCGTQSPVKGNKKIHLNIIITVTHLYSYKECHLEKKIEKSELEILCVLIFFSFKWQYASRSHRGQVLQNVMDESFSHLSSKAKDY